MRFEDVVRRMINENKNPLILDAWVDKDVEAFRCVKELFTQGNTMLEYIKAGNIKFKCDYKPGDLGMVKYAPEIRLYCLVDFENRGLNYEIFFK